MSVSGYDIAAVVLYGLAMPPLLAYSLLSVLLIRRRSDPVRLPFMWLRLALILLIVSTALNVANEGLIIAIEALEQYDFFSSLEEAIARTYDLSVFFSNLADNLILLCLVELGLSFLKILGYVGLYRNIIRYINLVAVVILFALTFALEGTDETVISEIYNESNATITLTANYDLFAAYYILYWILALPVLALAITVLYSSVKKKRLQTIASCFLTVSILNIIRTTWNFVYSVLYNINYDPDTTIIPEWVLVVSPILYTWVTVALFTMLIVIGAKKIEGLWSQQQYSYSNGQASAIPPPQPANEHNYVTSQQPHQSYAVMTGPPQPWTPESTGNNYAQPSQQYYEQHYPKPIPVVRNQVV